MATPVKMPELGESITEGTITRWIKQEGDRVEADEPLFEVSTDKVDTEVPSPVAGVLQSIKVQADETVEVGAELAVIGGGDGDSSEAKAEPAEEKKDTKKDEGPKEAKSPAENKAAIREKVASKGLLKVLGSTGSGGSAFDDVLGGSTGAAEIGEALAGAGGVGVATADNIGAGGPKGVARPCRSVVLGG